MGGQDPYHGCAIINKLNHPLSDVRERAFENIVSKLKRGLLPSSYLSDVIEIVLSALKSEVNVQLVDVLYHISLLPNGCALLLKSGVVEFLMDLLSKANFQAGRHAIQSILSNILSVSTGALQSFNIVNEVAYPVCDVSTLDSNSMTNYIHDKVAAKVDTLSCHENLQLSLLQSTLTVSQYAFLLIIYRRRSFLKMILATFRTSFGNF